MPVYEFRCTACGKKYEKRLSYSEYDQYSGCCPFCGSTQVNRIIRAVRVARGDKAHLSSLADPAALNAVDDDPRALGKMMKQMQTQLGANDMPGEFDEVVDRLEKGQTPDQIERDLPELSSSDNSED